MTEQPKHQPIPIKVDMHNPKDTAAYPARDRIYVRAVKGLHQQLRRYMGFVFLGLFMLLPWLQFDGHQAILFDLDEQKFNIFWHDLMAAGFYHHGVDPGDFSLCVVFCYPPFYGRVWCGYLCPQTVWTFIFIWVEEKIQGKPQSADENWIKIHGRLAK